MGLSLCFGLFFVSSAAAKMPPPAWVMRQDNPVKQVPAIPPITDYTYDVQPQALVSSVLPSTSQSPCRAMDRNGKQELQWQSYYLSNSRISLTCHANPYAQGVCPTGSTPHVSGECRQASLRDVYLQVRVATEPTLSQFVAQHQPLIISPADSLAAAQAIWIGIHQTNEWTFKIVDQGGSTIWHQSGWGSARLSWKGYDQHNEWVSPGLYTLQVITENLDYTHAIIVKFKPIKGLALYFPANIADILDSTEGRLVQLEERIKNLTDSLPFLQRSQIKKNSLQMPPSSAFNPSGTLYTTTSLDVYSDPNDSDVLKADLDMQNFRITRRVGLLRRHISQLQFAYDGLIQDALRSLDGKKQIPPHALYQKVHELTAVEQSLQHIHQSQLMYKKYAYKAYWRKKRTCPIPQKIKLFSAYFQNNGDLIFMGKINLESLECRPFNADEIKPETTGITYISTPQVEDLEHGYYKITIKEYEFDESLMLPMAVDE